MVDQPRFRAAFDFMRLRADAGEIEEVLADWWQEFSMADDNLRQDMIDQVRAEQQARPKPARVHRAPAPVRDREAREPSPPAAPAASDASADGAAGADAPRKRRRRRRSSGAGGGADGGSGGGGDGFAGGPAG
jgi:poly(A) polymerase